MINRTEREKAYLEDIISLQKRLVEWQDLTCYIKDLILEFDHVSNDPVKVLSDINNIIDTGFSDMETALQTIRP